MTYVGTAQINGIQYNIYRNAANNLVLTHKKDVYVEDSNKIIVDGGYQLTIVDNAPTSIKFSYSSLTYNANIGTAKSVVVIDGVEYTIVNEGTKYKFNTYVEAEPIKTVTLADGSKYEKAQINNIRSERGMKENLKTRKYHMPIH